MRIIPKRGLSLDDVHAPAGIPVECRDSLARELIALDQAVRAPAEEPAVRLSPVIETAIAPAPENAAVKRKRSR